MAVAKIDLFLFCRLSTEFLFAHTPQLSKSSNFDSLDRNTFCEIVNILYEKHYIFFSSLTSQKTFQDLQNFQLS